MRKLGLVLASAALVLAGISFAQGTLQTVQDRGLLRCGVNTGLPGFASVNEAGEWVGFDVDFCRALAAVVLGDSEAVEFRPLSASERFTALQAGEIDVLSRNTTWTSSRDTTIGLNFAPTTFYDGQGFIVRRNSGISELTDFEGRSICVGSGTTTELNLADVMAALDVQFTPVVFEQPDQLVAAYDDGQCDGYTTDKSGLIGRLVQLRQPLDHRILKVTISKEPLGPVVLHGDDQWFDVVKWTVFALFLAEEFGITSDNVDQVAESTNDPNARRFLGLDPENVEGFGLNASAFRNAIGQVGNYAEIFTRNLGPETPFDIERGLNSQYYEGGLLYAPPFR